MLIKLIKHWFSPKWIKELPSDHFDNENVMKLHYFIVNRLKQEGISGNFPRFYNISFSKGGRIYLRFHVAKTGARVYEMTWDGTEKININGNARTLIEAQKNIFNIIEKNAIEQQYGEYARQELAKQAAVYHDIIALLLTIYEEDLCYSSYNISSEAPKQIEKPVELAHEWNESSVRQWDEMRLRLPYLPPEHAMKLLEELKSPKTPS